MKGAENLKIYVDKNALQDYTTKLIAKEKTIFATKDQVGSPLVASTVAGMTDHDKIYVYVGSETGYTSGNWYYWDGSAWVSGGVYNSQGFVLDDTLTSATLPAQAKAVGDKVGQLENEAVMLADTVGESVPWETGTLGYGQKWDSGATTTNVLVNTTKYVDISKYKYLRYMAFCSPNSSTLLGIAFFTGKTQGTYISGVQGYSGVTNVGMKEQWAAVPAGAKYARFTVLDDYDGFFIEGFKNVYGLIAESEDKTKSIIFGLEDGETVKDEADSGTWDQGAVSESGIDPSVTTEAHSALISIGNYEAINIELVATDLSYWFTVFEYDGTNYSQSTPLGDIWLKRGGVRLEDKTKQYIVCVKARDGSEIDAATAKAAVKITLQSNYLPITKSVIDAANGNNINAEIPVVYGALSLTTTSGYSTSNANICTMPIEIGEFDALHFSVADPAYKYAIYTYNGTSFGNASGGYITADSEFTDKTVLYIVRVALAGGGDITAAQFATACKAIKITRVAYNHASAVSFGYERYYTDITRTLTFERKAISASGITDSTVSLLAKLPNDGNFECRLNRPVGKFAVWKVSGNTYTCLTGDWTYYQYRYTGDYSSDYYIAVAEPSGGTITLDYYNVVMVLAYVDAGTKQNISTPLSGKKIAVYGDSIVQGRMCKNGISVNIAMAKPWSNLLAETAGVEPHTFGLGGALVYDNNWKSLSRHYNDVTGFDVVFFCAGTNDYGSDIPLADFKAAYTTVLTGLVANNTKVVVCTPTRRTTTGTNDAGLTMQDYADAEIEIAEGLSVDVIDLYTLTNRTDYKAQLTDGLHPTEIGSRIIADIILNQYH